MIKPRKTYKKLILPEKFELYNKSMSGNYKVKDLCSMFDISYKTYKRIILEVGSIINKELQTY